MFLAGRVPVARAPLALVALLVLVAACGGDGDDEPVGAGPERAAAVYARAVGATVDDDVDADGPPVFVAHAEDELIDLEVQVGVIQRLDDVADVRFVDRREEAVDGDAPRAPVREDGVLVTLGPIVAVDGGVQVHVERYRREGQISARLMTLRPGDDGWTVAEEQPTSTWPRDAAG